MSPLIRIVIGPLVLAGAYGAMRLYQKGGLREIGNYLENALQMAGNFAGKIGEVPRHISVLNESNDFTEVALSAKALRETVSNLPSHDFANLGLGHACGQLIHGAVVRVCTHNIQSLELAQDLELSEATARIYTGLYWLGLVGHKFDDESTLSLRKSLAELHERRGEAEIATIYGKFGPQTALSLVSLLSGGTILEEFKTSQSDPMPALFAARALGYDGIIVKAEDIEARFVGHYSEQ